MSAALCALRDSCGSGVRGRVLLFGATDRDWQSRLLHQGVLESPLAEAATLCRVYDCCDELSLN